MGDFDGKLRPHLEAVLEPDEALEGVCACSQQKGLFKGGAVALGVTDRRLLVQELDRRGNPAGGPRSIEPGDLADAKPDGAGGGWAEVVAAIMDQAAVRLTLRLADGEKLRLMMMRGAGSPLGSLGGGESQRRGVEALAGFFRRLG